MLLLELDFCVCILTEVLDGKEITPTARQFLQNWQASREAARKRQESALSRQASGGISHTHVIVTLHEKLEMHGTAYSWNFFVFLNLIYLMRSLTSNQLHIKNHLKAHLRYKSCPRTLGTEDLVYGRTRTHNLVVESPVP